MNLLPKGLLVKTSELDQAPWSYARGPLGIASRARFHLVLAALRRLERQPDRRLVEVGYGSGLFLPELARQCDTLLGIDVHPHAAAVAAALRRVGADADLRQGSVESLPLPDASVDVAVVVSALEFVDDIHAAARELARVLRPGGALVVVTPGQGRLLDLGLTVLTGENPEDTFQGRRGTILPALRTVLREEAVTTFPPRWLPLMPRLYTCSLLRKG